MCGEGLKLCGAYNYVTRKKKKMNNYVPYIQPKKFGTFKRFNFCLGVRDTPKSNLALLRDSYVAKHCTTTPPQFPKLIMQNAM